jgi:hypothetical protein
LKNLNYSILFAGLVLTPSLAAQDAFVDKSASLGLSYVHGNNTFDMGMGGGSAWFDMDLDGDEDLFTIGSMLDPGLFRNDGGSFSNIAAGAGLDVPFLGATMGVAAGDYNNDGLTDLMLTNRGVNQLYRNNGDYTFTERSSQVGMTEDAWSVSASWADFDLDGDLDAYVGNYLRVMSFPYHFGAPNNLLINTATTGTPAFIDQAAALGVDNVGVFGASVPGHPYIAPTGQATAGCTLSVATLDENEDGAPDIQVGNDFGEWVIPDTLYRNTLAPGGALGFANVSAQTGFSSAPMYNMGITPGDFDHDGDWDFYKSNLGDNRLFRNDGGVYVDVAAQAGVLEGLEPTSGKLITSWGSSFGDVNNDGWEDLIVINGYIPSALFISNEVRAKNSLYLNNQDGTFTEVPDATSGMADEMVGRGIAVADVNRDGFLDHYVMNNGNLSVALPGDRSRYYENTGSLANPGAASWLELRLIGTYGNIAGLGSRIELTAGGTTWKRQVLGDPVFESSSSRNVHFGLGSTRFAEHISIDWSGGTHQELHYVPTGKFLELVEPTVLIEGLDAPVWAGDRTGGTYTYQATVRNQGKTARTANVRFDLHMDKDGPAAKTTNVQVQLQPGETKSVPLVVAVPAGTHAALKGMTITERVYVTSARGIDSRAKETVLP